MLSYSTNLQEIIKKFYSPLLRWLNFASGLIGKQLNHFSPTNKDVEQDDASRDPLTVWKRNLLFHAYVQNVKTDILEDYLSQQEKFSETVVVFH